MPSFIGASYTILQSTEPLHEVACIVTILPSCILYTMRHYLLRSGQIDR
jgi:hypothetical protein